MSTLFVDTVEPEGATTDLTLGASGGGDKVVVPGTIKISGGSPGAGKYLQSDADGDGSWVTLTVGDNTPSWSAYNASTQSITADTETVATLGSENWDTDSAFASNKFTVPSGEGGKYSISYGAKFNNINASNNVYMGLKVNGTKNDYTVIGSADPDANHHYLAANAILNLSASDYVELMVLIYSNTDNIQYAHMSGFRLAGV